MPPEAPAELAARPWYGGLPIPFVTATFDGRPDFRVHDPEARAICDSDRLCQLCGTPLDGEAEFIGYESSVWSRTFGEPPTHPACADYALAVCPWLGGSGWRTGHGAGVRVLDPPPAPDGLVWLTATNWSLVADPSGLAPCLYQVIPPFTWSWIERVVSRGSSPRGDGCRRN